MVETIKRPFSILAWPCKWSSN